MERYRSVLGGVLAIIVLAGCRLSVQAPPSFLTLERGRHNFKAITQDQGKIWIREFSYPKGGDLAFWSGVLKEDLKNTPGYTLVDDREIKDDLDLPGRELLFHVNMQGKVHGYLVRLHLVPRRFIPLVRKQIRVAQFLAPDDVFERHLEGVREAFCTMRP